jgi:integrase
VGSLVKDARNRSQFWYCCYTTADGRRLKKSTKETDKRKAKIVCEGFEAVEAQAKSGSATEEQFRRITNEVLERVTGKKASSMTARAWFEKWLKNQKGSVSEQTFVRYSPIVRHFLESIGPAADGRLESVTSEHVRQFRDELKDSGRSPKTVNLIGQVVKHAFAEAVREGKIDRNPCDTLRRILDRDKSEKGTFTPEAVARLVEAAEGDWKGLILAGYFTGARVSDLAQLKWSNVDLEEQSASIWFVQQKVKGKSRKAKVRVPIYGDLLEYLIHCPSSDHANAPVFPQLHDKPTGGTDGLSTGFRRIMERAGIDPGVIRQRGGDHGRSVARLSFHSLRHSFNSALANAEVSQEVRMIFTGHSSVDQNTDYTHMRFEKLRDAVMKLGGLPKGEVF